MSCHESTQAGKLFDSHSELNLLLQNKTHNDMNIYFDIDAGKTSFTRYSPWSLQNFNIYIPEESFQQVPLSITTLLLHIHYLRKLRPFLKFSHTDFDEQNVKALC